MRCLLLFVLALFPVLAQAQTPAFGERVGDVLDAAERAYFGLFPDVEGFVSATGSIGRNDTMRVAFETTATPRATLMLLPEQGHALRQFIATFEQYPSAFDNPRWQIVRPIATADVPVPYVNVERSVVEIEAEGRRFPGVILLATDSLVVLQPVERRFRSTASEALALPVSSITRVRPAGGSLVRNRNRTFALGMLLSVGAMGATTVTLSPESFTDSGNFRAISLWGMASYASLNLLLPRPGRGGPYAENKRYLEENAQLADRQPYDLPDPATMQDRIGTYPSLPIEDQPTRSLFSDWYRTYHLISVGQTAPGRLTDHGNAIIFNDYAFARPNDQIQTVEGARNSFAPGNAYDLSVRPIPWLRFGVTYHNQDVPTPTFRGSEELAYMIPGRHRRYAEVILPSPRYRGIGVDLAVGVGSEFNRVVVARESGGPSRRLSFTEQHAGRNTYVQSTLELFTTSRTSVFMRYTKRDLPTLSAPRLEERSPILGQPLQTTFYAEAHDVTFGYTEWTWGTRLHF